MSRNKEVLTMNETKKFYTEESEEMSVFKSYLRSLLRDLQDIEKDLNQEEIENAKEKIEKLLSDTQKGIED